MNTLNSNNTHLTPLSHKQKLENSSTEIDNAPNSFEQENAILQKSFKEVYDGPDTLQHEYDLLREAKLLGMTVDEYRRLYNLRSKNLLAKVAKRGSWQWTGFREKKLWDYLQWLFIPVVVTSLVYWYQSETEKSHKNRVILNTYFDDIEKLQSQQNKDKQESSSTSVAMAKTELTLQDIDDAEFNSQVFDFLRKANLIKSVPKWQSEQPEVKFPIDLSRANFGNDKLKSADLRGIVFKYTTFDKADLSESRLYQADLLKSSLTNANLNGAKLVGANLSGADLRGAHLEGADFRGANLTGVTLKGATLSDADFRGADLSGADLTDEDAKSSGVRLCKTILPSGKSFDSGCTSEEKNSNYIVVNQGLPLEIRENSTNNKLGEIPSGTLLYSSSTSCNNGKCVMIIPETILELTTGKKELPLAQISYSIKDNKPLKPLKPLK